MSSYQQDGRIHVYVYKKKIHQDKVRNEITPINKSKPRESTSQYSVRNKLSPSNIQRIPKALLKNNSCSIISLKNDRLQDSQYIVNNNFKSLFSKQRLYNSPFAQTKWRVYRVQLSSPDESCCCACNSTSMFEVMKTLYDCYKNKDCHHCDCILCGHLPREERRSGVFRADAAVGAKKVGPKISAEEKKAIAMEKKDKVLRELAIKGKPLPEGKTTSEKDLIDRIRHDLAIPPAPRTASQKKLYKKAGAKGLLVPLEGKSPTDKKKLLENQAELGIALPEGRTASEKSLVDSVKKEADKVLAEKKLKESEAKAAKAAKPPKPPKPPSAKPPKVAKTSSEKLKDAKPPKVAKTSSEKVKDAKPPKVAKTSSEKLKDAKPPKVAKTSSEKVKDAKPPKVAKTSSEKVKDAKPPKVAKTSSEKLKDAKPPKVAKTSSEKVKDAKPPKVAKTSSEKDKIAKPPSEKDKVAKLPSKKDKAAKTSLEKLEKAKKSGLLSPTSSEKLRKTKPPLEEKKPKDKIEVAKISSEKLRKAKASGLLEPIEGKKAKEKTIKEPVKKAPLSEVQKLDEKTRKVMKEKKGPSDECICGILTPESERFTPKIPAKIPSKVISTKGEPVKTSPEELTKAKATKATTPIEAKTDKEKEKILKGLSKEAVPLPKAKSASEKKMEDDTKKSKLAKKIPSKPSIKGPGGPDKAKKLDKKSADKLKTEKATKATTPIEAKTDKEKEKILKGLSKEAVPLPKAKSASEKKMEDDTRKSKLAKKIPSKASIKGPGGPDEAKKLDKKTADKLKTEKKMEDDTKKSKLAKKIPSKASIKGPGGPDEAKKLDKKTADKLKKAEAANLLEKEKASKALDETKKLDMKTLKNIKEGKGPSDECICGILTPESEKFTPKILPKVPKMPVPSKELPKHPPPSKELPKHPPPSKELPKHPPKTEEVAKKSSEKLRKAKAAGLLEGKKHKDKEKILKDLIEQGLPLPEPSTVSEKKLIEKLKAAKTSELAPKTPPKTEVAKKSSEKLRKAKASGLLEPIEGKKSKEKKEKKSKESISGKKLPDAKEKKSKESISGKKLPDAKEKKSKESISGKKLPDAKEKKSKESISGKKLPDAKEKKPKESISGKKLPDAKEKKIVPEAKRAKLEKERERKEAKRISGPLSPEEARKLDAKTLKVMKEKKGPSDECICELLGPDSVRIPLKVKDKLAEAKAAGLLTPLEGKTPERKEEIIRGLAKLDIPLPEPRTDSEKRIIDKVRAEMGKPPAKLKKPKKAKAEKESAKKAKKEKAAAGPPTSAADLKKAKETKAEKERAKKDKKEKAAAGPPTSAADLEKAKEAKAEKVSAKKAKKEKAAVGPPTSAADLEKAKKTKAKSGKVSGASKKIAAAQGMGDMTHDIEEIVKTTKCDQACGCETKKIRFKHSFVKIKVTSPDISSFCPCPDDCIPRVKGGVFVDNEGIKVTIGSVLVIPTFCPEKKYHLVNKSDTSLNASKNNTFLSEKDVLLSNFQNNTEKVIQLLHRSLSSYSSSEENLNAGVQDNSNIYDFDDCYTDNLYKKSGICDSTNAFKYLMTCCEKYETPQSLDTSSSNKTACETSPKLSYVSIFIESEPAENVSDLSSNIATISIISFHNSSIVSRSSHYICCAASGTSISSQDAESSYKKISTSTTSISEDNITKRLRLDLQKNMVRNKCYIKAQNNVIVYRESQNNPFKYTGNERTNKYNNTIRKPLVVIDDIYPEPDINEIVAKLVEENKELSKNSSLLIVVPVSNDNDDLPSQSDSSTVWINLSESNFDKAISRGKRPFKGVKLVHTPKRNRKSTSKKQEHYNEVNMDTTEDRPCCCKPNYEALGQTSCTKCVYRNTAAVVSCEVILPVNTTSDQGEKRPANYTETSATSYMKPKLEASVSPFFVSPNYAFDCHDIKITDQMSSEIINLAAKSNHPEEQYECNEMKHSIGCGGDDVIPFKEHKAWPYEGVKLVHMPKRNRKSTSKRQEHYNEVNIDTTEDRPCCCKPNDEALGQTSCTKCLCRNTGTVVSCEVILPMITTSDQGGKRPANYTETSSTSYLEPQLDANVSPLLFSRNDAFDCDDINITDQMFSEIINPAATSNHPEEQYQCNEMKHSIGCGRDDVIPFKGITSKNKNPMNTRVDASSLCNQDSLTFCGQCKNTAEDIQNLNKGVHIKVPVPQGTQAKRPAPPYQKPMPCPACVDVATSTDKNDRKHGEVPNTRTRGVSAVASPPEADNGDCLRCKSDPDLPATHNHPANKKASIAKKVKLPEEPPKKKKSDTIKHVPLCQFGGSEYFGTQCTACKKPKITTNPSDSSISNKSSKSSLTSKSKKSTKSKSKKQWRKKSNCECEPEPPESPGPPEPPGPPKPEDFSEYRGFYNIESEPDAIIIIDDRKAARLIKSDMTQTTSGFNVKVKKIPKPPEVGMTFEEAIAFFEKYGDINIEEECFEDCDGVCKNAKKSPEKEVVEEVGEFKGFKLSVGGKGSGSKGLSGVCCFDRLLK